MILVTSIGTKHGYSGYDHLIDDGPYQDLLGQRYRSVSEIRRAVEQIQRDHVDQRVAVAPVGVEIVLANGDRRDIDA